MKLKSMVKPLTEMLMKVLLVTPKSLEKSLTEMLVKQCC
jgi:hypothetical protein